MNDHSSDAMSNTILAKECLGKSEKYIRERKRERETERERERERETERERNSYQTWQLSLISYPSQAINTWFMQMFMTERKQ